MIEIWETAAIAVSTGLISSFGTITALKIEIKWLKETIEKLEKRLDNHSRRLSSVEIGQSCPIISNGGKDFG